MARVYSVQRRPWTVEDVRDLKARMKAGEKPEKIAKAQRRSPGAVRQKAFAEGLSFLAARRKGTAASRKQAGRKQATRKQAGRVAAARKAPAKRMAADRRATTGRSKARPKRAAASPRRKRTSSAASGPRLSNTEVEQIAESTVNGEAQKTEG